MDVATSTKKVAVVKQKIRALRDNVDSSQNMVSGQPLNGNNVQAESPEEYYRRLITVADPGVQQVQMYTLQKRLKSKIIKSLTIFEGCWPIYNAYCMS